jgi:hypothetical protein
MAGVAMAGPGPSATTMSSLLNGVHCKLLLFLTEWFDLDGFEVLIRTDFSS